MPEEITRWHLEDVEAKAKEHPRTFFIPPEHVRQGLERGDMVKLVFFVDDPVPEGYEAERMWVEVRAAAGGRYVGTLANEPSFIKGLSWGDRVEFGPEHVSSIQVDESEIGYRVNDKAIVSRRLADADVRPTRCHRDEPLRPDDSGWQLLFGDESSEESSDPSQAGVTSLGYLTDKFPELEPMFRDGQVGQTWQWNVSAGAYERVE